MVDDNLRDEIENKIETEIEDTESKSTIEEINDYHFVERVVGSRKGDVIVVVDLINATETEVEEFEEKNYMEKLDYEGEFILAHKTNYET